ncbi:MAG: hypothetical protein JWM47_1786 [Acidimicrobiales bacterium]|nr:hypothetical protein [Acidimicrobiales bacterium]
MARLRTNSEQQIDAAIEELNTLASTGRGLAIVSSGPEQVTITVGKQSWPARVLIRDAVSLRDAQMLVASEARGSKIIAANQLSTDAKDFLTAHNEESPNHWWSWLDRRGELQLNHPEAKASGVVHFDKSSLTHPPVLPGGWRVAAPSSNGPIRGRAGISVAASILMNPTETSSIREIARQAQMSHGAIGEASKLLRDAGLVAPSGQPQVPELFWALAAVWHPVRISPVTNQPTLEVAERLHGNLSGPAAMDMVPGWCLGGDDAAAAWGAPVFSGAGRPWIWVPQEGDARRAERTLTPATWDDYQAVVAVPPTPLVCIDRRWPPKHGRLPFLPTAHPLFLALDLAQDPARGREILNQWHPADPEVVRVW